MANTKSAKKSVRKSKEKRKYNVSHRSMLRTFIKKSYAEMSSEDKDKIKIENACVLAQKIIDQKSCKGILHKKKASRYKSHIHTRMKSILS